jgi:hypothetical protein
MIAIISVSIIITFVILNSLNNQHQCRVISALKRHQILTLKRNMFIYDKRAVITNAVFMYDLALVNKHAIAK